MIFDRSSLLENHNFVKDIIEDINLPIREKEFRKKRIRNEVLNSCRKHEVTSPYFSYTHEIKSIQFLQKYFDKVKIQIDFKHKSGFDAEYEEYYIEFVSLTHGDKVKNGLKAYEGSGSFDYKKKLSIMVPLITQALQNKVENYDEFLNKNIIMNKPLIIFIGTGSLRRFYHPGENGIDFLRPLLGITDLQVVIQDNSIIEYKYAREEQIFKYNGSPIKVDYFSEKYKHLAAVLFFDSSDNDLYDDSNVYIFHNPFSDYKLNNKLLENFIQWEEVNGYMVCNKNL